MPFGAESVSEKISREYYNLTGAEKKAADYILENQQKVQFMSISELAEACGVAEATVSRFCRRLGYKGYNAFKLAVAQSLAALRGSGASPMSGRVRTGDSLEESCLMLHAAGVAALDQTMELMTPETVYAAVELLEKAGKVLCMGQGGSMLLAQAAAHQFSSASGKFFAVGDSHMQVMAAANLEKDDVVLFFSYSGSTRDMLDTLAIARERGAKCVLVTRFPKSPGAALADVVLQCGADESPLQVGSAQAKIAQIYVIEVLFYELCKRHADDTRQRRNRVARALADKHV